MNVDHLFAVEGIGKMILHLEELQETLGAGRCGA